MKKYFELDESENTLSMWDAGEAVFRRKVRPASVHIVKKNGL